MDKCYAINESSDERWKKYVVLSWTDFSVIIRGKTFNVYISKESDSFNLSIASQGYKAVEGFFYGGEYYINKKTSIGVSDIANNNDKWATNSAINGGYPYLKAFYWQHNVSFPSD